MKKQIKTNIQAELLRFDFNVLPHNYYQEAYGRVTFYSKLPDGTTVPVCENIGSSKGKVTPEQKKEQLSNLNKEIEGQGYAINLIKVVEVYNNFERSNPYYKVDKKDPIFLEVNKILNGNS